MAIIIPEKDIALTYTSKHRYNTFYILGISFITALSGYLFGFDFAVGSFVCQEGRPFRQYGAVALETQALKPTGR